MTFCYECHELPIHNPVFLPNDIDALSHLVRLRGLDEDEKPKDCARIAGRIRLFQEVVSAGIAALLNENAHGPTQASGTASPGHDSRASGQTRSDARPLRSVCAAD
jgi:hypothetical protein